MGKYTVGYMICDNTNYDRFDKVYELSYKEHGIFAASMTKMQSYDDIDEAKDATEDLYREDREIEGITKLWIVTKTDTGEIVVAMPDYTVPECFFAKPCHTFDIPQMIDDSTVKVYMRNEFCEAKVQVHIDSVSPIIEYVIDKTPFDRYYSIRNDKEETFSGSAKVFAFPLSQDEFKRIAVKFSEEISKFAFLFKDVCGNDNTNKNKELLIKQAYDKAVDEVIKAVKRTPVRDSYEREKHSQERE